MSQDLIIAPSILAADFARLGEQVTAVLAAGADWIHVDVMDNHYVPNLTFGPLVVTALRNYGITAPIDVHLMVEPVDGLINSFAKAGATYITIHPEASKHVQRSLALIHAVGCKAGLALNPASPLALIEHVLDDIDLLLLMSVNPGFGGQQFITHSYEKAKLAHQLIHKHNPAIRLAIDGGVDLENIAAIAACGVNTVVAGSAIFNSPDFKQTIASMRQAMERVRN